MKKFFFLFIFCFTISVSSAYSANWYVDNAVGSSGNGTSWATAWKAFSNVVWGSSGVKAGDTLYISGGSTSKTYQEVWSVGASGTSSNRIYIRTGQDTGHNGKVIFDYAYLGTSATASGVTLASYVTVDGSVGSSRNMTFKNLRNISTGTSAIVFYSAGSNVTVKYVNIDACNNGFLSSSSTGNEVSHSSLTNMKGDAGVKFVASTGTWDANLIHHNTISLLANSSTLYGPDGVQIGHGVSIYNNTFRVDLTSGATSTQHCDFIQSVGDYVKVYNNEFINIGDSGFDSDGSYFNTDPANIYIYNNVFRIETAVDIYPEFIRFYNCSNSVTNVKILNNTFADITPYTAAVYFNCSASSSGIEVKNNIFKNITTAFSRTSGFNVDTDYNVYSGVSNIIDGGTPVSPSTWIAAHEPHSNLSSPSFTSYTAFSATNDFRLSSGDTAAKDRGTSLSSYFTTDKDGNTRTGTWDIGAFEGEGAAEIATPRGLTVIPN